MRTSQILPTFWTRGSGKKLRGKPHAQVLALYLMTCQARNLIGLYYIAKCTIRHDCGFTHDELEQAFSDTAEAELAFYDDDTEMVWVPNLARHQIGDRMKPGDKRRKAVRDELEMAGDHRFADQFIELYAEPYNLTAETDVPTKVHTRDIKKEGSPPYPIPIPTPHGDPEQVEPASPGAQTTRRDPLAYMRGEAPTRRADVNRVRDEWQRLFGYPEHKWRGVSDLDAALVAETIDAYGEANCLLMLRYAPSDGMVNGTADPQRRKHDSIRYLFENERFARLLREATKRQRTERQTLSASEAIRRAKEL